MKLWAALGAIAIAIAGCKSTSGLPDVTGTWSYSATASSTSPSLSCTVTGGVLNLVQTQTTINGTYANITLSCAGGTVTDGPFSGGILNGTIAGADVLFGFDIATLTTPNDSWSSTGIVQNATMSGQVHITVDFGGTTGQVTLAGTFTATPQ